MPAIILYWIIWKYRKRYIKYTNARCAVFARISPAARDRTRNDTIIVNNIFQHIATVSSWTTAYLCYNFNDKLLPFDLYRFFFFFLNITRFNHCLLYVILSWQTLIIDKIIRTTNKNVSESPNDETEKLRTRPFFKV